MSYLFLVLGVAATACATPTCPSRDIPRRESAGEGELELPAVASTPPVAANATTTESAPMAAAQPDTNGALADELPTYDVPVLEPRALAALARETCERSKASGRPILVEFSAAWCEDCRKLDALKRAAPLGDELSHWEALTINVGEDGFQHPELMRAFRVDAIAKLVAVRPRDCALPLRFWKAHATRTLSGLAEPARLNAGLTDWLMSARARAAR